MKIFLLTLTSKDIDMHIVATKLGIPSPPPYLSLSRNDDAFLNGINYASGGAGILNETGVYFVFTLIFLFLFYKFYKVQLFKFCFYCDRADPTVDV